MKNKFIRILSPITVSIIALLDAGVISFGVFAIKKLQAKIDIYTILFAIIEVFALVIAILVSKEILSNGVKFSENGMEFTGLDENNIFEYSDIEKIETFKDTKASFKKNFIDRFSHITITKKDNSIVTVDLGLTTKRKLNKIKVEIEKRI